LTPPIPQDVVEEIEIKAIEDDPLLNIGASLVVPRISVVEEPR